MHVVEALLHSASAGGGDAECTTSLSRTTEIFHSHRLALAPNSNIHETEKKIGGHISILGGKEFLYRK